MFDLITFGETMLRLTPEKSMVIEQGSSLNMYPAGSELNVAVAASRLGLKVSYATKLAANPLGRFINNKCREQGVDTSWIKWSSENRQGLYFFENGSPPRPGVAYYDRESSAFSNIKETDLDWESILNKTRVFLTSGINPAISKNVDIVTLNSLKVAKKLDKIVAFDINYRSKLWGQEQAKERIEEYLPYVDILFTSVGDAQDILGFQEPPGEKLVSEIANKYNISTVCLIYGSEKEDSLWEIVCISDGKIYTAEQRGKLTTIDRLGAGDAFAGGFIAGYLESGPELAVNIGNALITLTNTFSGDFTWITREQVDSFLKGSSTMVER